MEIPLWALPLVIIVLVLIGVAGFLTGQKISYNITKSFINKNNKKNTYGKLRSNIRFIVCPNPTCYTLGENVTGKKASTNCKKCNRIIAYNGKSGKEQNVVSVMGICPQCTEYSTITEIQGDVTCWQCQTAFSYNLEEVLNPNTFSRRYNADIVFKNVQ